MVATLHLGRLIGPASVIHVVLYRPTRRPRTGERALRSCRAWKNRATAAHSLVGCALNALPLRFVDCGTHSEGDPCERVLGLILAV